MPTDKEVMQQALASLEGYARNCRCEGSGGLCDAGKALKARLSQPEPKPACWLHKGEVRLSATDLPPEETIPLYTIPQPREFIGLTDDEINTVAYNNHPLNGIRPFSRAIEAKLKEKNAI